MWLAVNDSGYSIPLVINCWNCPFSSKSTKRSLWESAISKWCVSGKTVIPRGLDNASGKADDVSLPKRWTNIPSSVNLWTHEPKEIHYWKKNKIIYNVVLYTCMTGNDPA